jgi:hypothetical protein
MVNSVLSKNILRRVSFDDLLRMEEVFDSHPASIKPQNWHRKSSQERLYLQLCKIFPEEEILKEYNHPKILSNKGYSLELDFFIARLNLAFEYQVTI